VSDSSTSCHGLSIEPPSVPGLFIDMRVAARRCATATGIRDCGVSRSRVDKLLIWLTYRMCRVERELYLARSLSFDRSTLLSHRLISLEWVIAAAHYFLPLFPLGRRQVRRRRWAAARQSWFDHRDHSYGKERGSKTVEGDLAAGKGGFRGVRENHFFLRRSSQQFVSIRPAAAASARGPLKIEDRPPAAICSVVLLAFS
jgi:hypothetical protein